MYELLCRHKLLMYSLYYKFVDGRERFKGTLRNDTFTFCWKIIFPNNFENMNLSIAPCRSGASILSTCAI